MKKAQSTPGPWKQSGSMIYSPNNGNICELSEIRGNGYIRHRAIGLGSPDWDKAVANGRLIAIAPELLAIARRLIVYRDSADAMGFQLEKADDFIEQFREVVSELTNPTR